MKMKLLGSMPTSLQIGRLNTPHPVIALLPGQAEIEDKGATMRLGAYPCHLEEGSRALEIYGESDISERHRHRYEFNADYRERLEAAGMRFSGWSPDGRLAEIVELPDHPFFVASQFHPEFASKPFDPHPLFRAFVQAAALHSPPPVSEDAQE